MCLVISDCCTRWQLFGLDYRREQDCVFRAWIQEQQQLAESAIPSVLIRAGRDEPVALKGLDYCRYLVSRGFVHEPEFVAVITDDNSRFRSNGSNCLPPVSPQLAFEGRHSHTQLVAGIL